MATLSTASLNIDFSQSGDSRLLIQLESGIYFDGSIPFHIYPKNPDNVFVSAGSYTFHSNRERTINYEIVKFEGTSRAQLKIPGVLAVGLVPGSTLGQSFYVIDPIEGFLQVFPDFGVDTTTSELIVYDPGTFVEIEAYGGLEVYYTVAYSRYLYTPRVQTYPVVQQTFGQIYARKGRTVETLEITNEFVNNPQYAEAWTVYSDKIVTNTDTQEYEKPPGWPDDNDYNTGEFPVVTADKPDADNSVTIRRIHARGQINRDGYQSRREYHHDYLHPYIGNANYHPVFKFVRNNSPSEEYNSAFASIDWNAVLTKETARWTGLTE